MSKFKAIFFISTCCLLLLAGIQGSASAKEYSVLKKITLGGEGGWDYLIVDTVGQRLFISRGTHVMVMDLKTDSLAGDIQGTNGVHGIALAYDLNKGYISDGRDSDVTVFDLHTLKVLRKVPVQGRNPDAIMYEPDSKRVFTFNGRSENATAIDAQTDSVVGLVPLGGKPEFPVYDGKGTIYVNIEDKSEIAGFDPATLKVKSTWPIAPGEEPSGLAIDRANGILFSVCGNKMMQVVDIASGKVIASVPTGEGTDGAAFDPATGCAFASNGSDGTLTVVQEKSPGEFSVAQNVATAKSARTVALDPVTHRLYLSAAKMGPAPEPTKDNPRPRPKMEPGSFMIVVVGEK